MRRALLALAAVALLGGCGGYSEVDFCASRPDFCTLAVSGFEPASAPAGTDVTVTLHGTGFEAPMLATFGDQEVKVEVVSRTEARARLAGMPAGDAVIVVTRISDDHTTGVAHPFVWTP